MRVARCLLVCLAFCVAAVAAQAQSTQSVTAYVWGNSLFHHLSNSDDTTVPHWLSRLARADGREIRLDGQWGFVRDFAHTLPPQPNWSFREVRGAWSSERRAFAAAGFDTIILNPANFIQYQAPDAPYEGANPSEASPVSATAEVFSWVTAQGVKPVFFLYEGWAELGQFPPTRRKYRKYVEYALGDYHDWYRAYHAAVAQALPKADVRLIPAGSVIARLVSDGPLAELRPTDLYIDDAPHGTETAYFLAAMITYTALYNARPPESFLDFDKVHPLVVEKYEEVVAFVWDAVQHDVAPRSTEVTAAPQLPDVRDPEPIVVAAPTVPKTPQPLAPVDTNATGLATPSLAMGLNGIADFSTQHPFINLMKSARPWVGHLPNEWGAISERDLREGGHLNEDGWPLSLPDGVTQIESFILTDQPKDAVSLEARYRVRWEGQGDLSIGGVARAERMTGGDNTLWFTYRPTGEGLVALIIRQIDPADPIRNIEVIREDHVPLYEAGAIYNPDFVARIADLRSLRFMDWTFTNGSEKREWADRARPEHYTFVGPGVPVEYIIRLANLIGADPWVNMPHMADDTFMRRYAEAMRDGLDPRLRIYVEYSNEVWNFIFPQAVHARDQAEARWGARAGDDAWMQWAGMRAAQMADIWGAVFSETPERIIPTIGVHSGWLGLEEPLLEAPLWVAEGNARPANRFRAYAVTGYFGYELGGDDHAPEILDWLKAAETKLRAEGEAKGLMRVALREYVRNGGLDAAFPAVAQRLHQGSIQELINVIWPYHADVAARYGMQMVMYEGGTHVAPHGAWSSNETLSRFFQDFNYSPEMARIYAELLVAWRDTGGTLFNAFVDIAPPSQFGSWGALRHIDDETARWDALMAFNADQATWWENRPADTFLQGVTRWGGAEDDWLEGTTEEDFLIGGPGADVLVSFGRSDILNGGPGEDLAVLPGARSDYKLTRQGKRLLAQRGRDIVSMVSVERLQFDDIEVAVGDL